MKMTRTALACDLKAMLGNEVADRFQPEDLERHLDLAALDLARVRPRTLADNLTLVADQAEYAAPADLLRPKFSDWGHKQRQMYKPWDPRYPTQLPTLTVAEADGVRSLVIRPAPTSHQISCLGHKYPFFYYATHTISDDEAQTTVQAHDRDLLLLRATIAAMTELANLGTVKPIQLHKGMGSTAKVGTAAEWVKWLSKQYEAAA